MLICIWEVRSKFSSLEKSVSPPSYLHSQFSLNRRSNKLDLVQFPFEYICWFGLPTCCFSFAYLTKKLLVSQSPNHWDLMTFRDHFIGHHIHISVLHIGRDDHS